MQLSKPQKFVARVSDKYFISDNERYLYLKFELVSPDRINFVAGQYVSLKINEEGERRSYSIVSTPDDNHGFHLLVEITNGGRGSEYLQKIKLGEKVEVLAPLGRFAISENTEKKLLFVATGSGIVPIWSMINDLLLNKKETRQIRLHWGMRSEADLFFVDNLERLAESHPNLVFDIVLSKPSEEWALCNGHVQDCLSRDFSSAHSINSGQAGSGLRGWEGYVCGSTERVMEIGAKLEELGMKRENIYHEKFA